MEHQSNPTAARPVDEQVDVENAKQADYDFHYDI